MKGYDADGIAKTEADHSWKAQAAGGGSTCAICAKVIEHVHNAEIEISEGPAPSREADAEGYFEYFVPVRNIPQCE
jgi:hypothetical protein